MARRTPTHTKTVARRAAARPPRASLAAPGTRGGSGVWWPLVHEPYTGAWQKNAEITTDTALSGAAVFACVTLIAADIGKLALRLVARTDDGVWVETTSAAFSPVLRKPNRYQTIGKFVEQWITSKLIHGNTYVLKQRDDRGVVIALYVLDPTRVCPLVAPDGSVYYEVKRDDLAEVSSDRLVVPQSEIIHDLMIALFHPLIGVSPIYACARAAAQQIAIQDNASAFFTNSSRPSGILTAPGAISDDKALELKTRWEQGFSGPNRGNVAVMGDGLTFEGMADNAVDAQLIEQLKWTGDMVCACYHVPPYMVGLGPPPPYANIEPLLQQYYSQCLQALITAFESALDEGLGLPTPTSPYGTEFDIDDLIWLDHAARSKAAADGIGSGGMSPDEARKRYFNLGAVPGGNTPYLQEQYFSLAALAERDAAKPFAKPVLAPTAPSTEHTPPPPSSTKFWAQLRREVVEHAA